ncbi:MAG: hypothetical protein A3F91_10205 [Flavobacteria bacterium RIFCSPLOWO2_12_FULL_35_11]|nr:MAG: hypothetical protein A3F91_10205 [Flavobacteria bacterium RIFCSPLOWO2_12_FULL_35_11]
MLSKKNIKEILAKEILLFFFAIALLGVVYGFLLLRNYYYDYQERTYNKENILLKTQLDSLIVDKTDNLTYIFDQIRHKTITYKVNYDLPQSTKTLRTERKVEIINVPAENEKEFLNKYPEAVRVVTFIAFKDTFDIEPKDLSDFLKAYPEAKSFNNRFKKLSPIFVDLEDFKAQLFKSPKDVFDILKVDTSFQNFCVNYDVFQNFFRLKEYEILNEKIMSGKESIKKSIDYKMSYSDITELIIIISLILVVLLYPLRLCFILILWAIKTLRHPTI